MPATFGPIGASGPQGRPQGPGRGGGGHRASALQPLRRASSTNSRTPCRTLGAITAGRRRAGPGAAFREAARIFVQLLAPMMPHLAEECWERSAARAWSRTRPGRSSTGAAGRGRDHPAGSGQRKEARRRHRRPRRGPGGHRSGRRCPLTPCSGQWKASRRARSSSCRRGS